MIIIPASDFDWNSLEFNSNSLKCENKALV